MWEDNKKILEIKKLFAPKLTEMEFQFFVGLGKATGLNPFTREIWCVKYQDNAPAQVFIGRDGYRKAAQAHHDYDFHQSDAVYENDEFEVINGEVHHKYKLTNRGALVGAYCIAKRHKSSRPMYVFAELKEYSTGKSLWNSQSGKPATMIKKVAESQCLRACFQDLLGGTYGEEEMTRNHGEERQVITIEGNTQTDRLKAILNVKEQEKQKECDLQDIQVIETQDDKPAKSVFNSGRDDLPVSDEQLDEITSLIKERELSEEQIVKALSNYNVTAFEDLSDAQARLILLRLRGN